MIRSTITVRIDVVTPYGRRSLHRVARGTTNAAVTDIEQLATDIAALVDDKEAELRAYDRERIQEHYSR